MEHWRELGHVAKYLVGQRNLLWGEAVVSYMGGTAARANARNWLNSLDAAARLEEIGSEVPMVLGPVWYQRFMAWVFGPEFVLMPRQARLLRGPEHAARLVSVAKRWEAENKYGLQLAVFAIVTGWLLARLWGMLPDMTQPQRSQLAGMLAYTAEPAWESGISRLRRRSRFVNRLSDELKLEKGIVGSILRGRWTPDLPTASWPAENRFLAGLLRDGAKVLGGGLCGKSPIPAGLGPEDPRTEVVTYLRIDISGTEILVIPKLVGFLSVRSVFCKRDSALVGSLKTKAIEWCRQRALDHTSVSLALPGSVALACARHAPEEEAESVLELAASWPHRLLGLVWPVHLSRWWLEGSR